MKSRARTSVERLATIAIVLCAVVVAVAASAVALWTMRMRGRQPASPADAIASAIARGAAPAPLLDAFVTAGTIRSAVLYRADGAVVARSGAPSSAELICRSLPGGASLCVEPVTGASAARRQNLIALGWAIAAAIVIGLVLAWIAASAIRARLHSIRQAIQDAMRDATYATRLQPAGGALAPVTASVNDLLDQVQARDTALQRRSTDLEAANKDLESFASAVSHDLRAPLGSIAGFAQALEEDYRDKLDEAGAEWLHWIRESCNEMQALIEGLLTMSRVSRAEIQREAVDLSAMARGIAGTLQRNDPNRNVTFAIADCVVANGDERLLRAVLENLIGNAWKFTSRRDGARIELGVRDEHGQVAFYIRDNGAGFDPAHAAKMFRPFQRLHSDKEFHGTGIGLATVHKIVQRHGGQAWAEGEPGRGATVYFTLGPPVLSPVPLQRREADEVQALHESAHA